MVAVITYPSLGRGSFPRSGAGGTLSDDGLMLGAYYTLAAGSQKQVGSVGAKCDVGGLMCSIDFYAVWKAVVSIQQIAGAVPDGVFGPMTFSKVKTWQHAHGLVDDGIVGPTTCRYMYSPIARSQAAKVDSLSALSNLVVGHAAYESGWDAGAVGRSTPQDLGLGQINGPANKTLTADFRLDVNKSLLWMAQFVDSNLTAMSLNVRDAVAAYNLGQGGARSWVKVGRPDVWVRTYTLSDGTTKTISTDVKTYIDRVLALSV